jgi:hypothetical protein
MLKPNQPGDSHNMQPATCGTELLYRPCLTPALAILTRLCRLNLPPGPFVLVLPRPGPVGVTFVLLFGWGACLPPGKLKEGLRDRNSPTCTLSQNGYGDISPPLGRILTAGADA